MFLSNSFLNPDQIHEFLLWQEWLVPGKRLEMRATGIGLLSTFSQALPVETENLFLKARESHLEIDKLK